MATMKALVKARPEPGLWLEDVPVPEVGINDVLIRIHKTSICGTDVHIYNWDEWAQKTIPVPMVVGPRVRGQSSRRSAPTCTTSSRATSFAARATSSAAAAATAWPAAATSARTPAGVGVNRPGAFAEYLCIPVTNVWYCDPTIPLDVLSCFDPLGNADAHGALLRRARRGRAHHRRGPDRRAWRPPSCGTPARATSSSPT